MACVWSQGTICWSGLPLSFLNVDSGEQIKISRHGHKYLCPHSHLPDWGLVFLATEEKEEGKD